jgi:hypothetical protein
MMKLFEDGRDARGGRLWVWGAGEKHVDLWFLEDYYISSQPEVGSPAPGHLAMEIW